VSVRQSFHPSVRNSPLRLVDRSLLGPLPQRSQSTIRSLVLNRESFARIRDDGTDDDDDGNGDGGGGGGVL